MIPLAKLNPKWIGVLRPNSGEGIQFGCPVCGPKHALVAYFSNPLDGQPRAEWQKPVWERVGETFEQLTVRPSMHYPCFHGWVERGRVFGVGESPLTALLTIDGKPQIVALSPEQTINLARQASLAAEKMLGESSI